MFPKVINIGPITFHLYGLIIALAIYIGYLLAQKRAHLYKIPPKLFEDPLLMLPLILALVGARIYHVLDYWQIYQQSPASILKIASGGLGIWGALAGLLLGFWVVSKVRKISLLSILDLAAPSVLLAQAIGRFGNYVNQEAFGPPTNLPWGVYISPENRPLQFLSATHFHPTFFYEAIIDFVFFVILLHLSKPSTVRGRTFALYLIFYSIGRFIVEFLRTDTATVGAVKIAQVLAALAFVIGLFLLKKDWKIRG